MAKACFIDVETTGLDPVKNGILQIAGQIEIDGKMEERFNIECRPFDDDEVNAAALAVNGIELDSLKDRQDPREAFSKLKRILSRYVAPYDSTDKFWFFAYNAPFDSGFMREFFNKNGDKYYGSWFWTPAMDLMVLAAACLINERPSMPNFKLATVAKHLGVEVAEASLHDAMYDVLLMRQVFAAVTDPAKGEKFDRPPSPSPALRDSPPEDFPKGWPHRRRPSDDNPPATTLGPFGGL